MEQAVRIIIKIEIETLYDRNGIFSPFKMEQLSMKCANLQNSGAQVLLVSSGAIALGTARLGMKNPPEGITAKQATAAVGQAELIKSYQDYFDNYDQTVAQVLITKDVVDHPLRNKNAKNTLHRLLDKGIIPIINENDSVSTNDIILNDNYPLVLIVASLTDADAIVVNTFEGNIYQLLLRNNSTIREINLEEFLELSERIKSKSLPADQAITGFPDYSQFAGLN